MKLTIHGTLPLPDLQHKAWELVLGNKLFMAPIGEAVDVLDIGTGTGIWAIEFARQHPESQVVGTDISLVQPRKNLPHNCTFEREDSEEEWVFDKLFDYIHWRLMFTCFGDFKAMIQKVFDHLKPGGCEYPRPVHVAASGSIDKVFSDWYRTCLSTSQGPSSTSPSSNLYLPMTRGPRLFTTQLWRRPSGMDSQRALHSAGTLKQLGNSRTVRADTTLSGLLFTARFPGPT